MAYCTNCGSELGSGSKFCTACGAEVTGKTRNKDTEMMPFKEGSMKIATKSECPIVPVALSNTAEVFENHLPFVKATHVIIEFGDPIETKGMDKERQKHLGRELHDLIKSMKEENDKNI